MRDTLAIAVVASAGVLEYESRADRRRRRYSWLTRPLGRRVVLWMVVVAVALAAGTTGAYAYWEKRQAANQVRCVSGLRSIGLAMHLYLQNARIAEDFGRKSACEIDGRRSDNEAMAMIERSRLHRVGTAAIPNGPMRGQVLEIWQDTSRTIYYVRPPDGSGGPLWQAGPFVAP